LVNYGFNFETLYHLDLKTLYDIVQIIRGEGVHMTPDHDVIIRGCIIPFLRDATKAPKGTDKDTIMRLALIAVAKSFKIPFKDWDEAHTDDIASAVRLEVQSRLAERLGQLDEKEREKVLGIARNNLAESAKTMGVPLAGAGAVLAGELSGFGIYLATTTGLHALSLALGTTFSWGVYQGATALLGVILGPIGWAVAGVGVVGSLAMSVLNWMKAKRDRQLALVVVALLFAVGESPFVLFGLSYQASFDDAKSVYRAMMKTFHPDRREASLPQWLHDDFNQKLLRCQEAYERIEGIFEKETA